MVSQLKYFRQDPMFPKKDRGAGWYYYRGNLTSATHYRTIRGKYWSKYEEKKDGNRFTAPTNVKDVIRAETKGPHKADYKTRKIKKKQGETQQEYETRKRRLKNRIRTTRKGDEGGFRGWF